MLGVKNIWQNEFALPILTLKAVTVFCLAPCDVKHSVYKLCTFSVVTLCPVVASTSLAKNEVVRPAQSI